MPDNQTFAENFIMDLLTELQIFIGRPNIQMQLIIVVAVMAVGFIVDQLAHKRIFSRYAEPEKYDWRPGVRLIIYPLVGIVLTFVAIPIFLSQGLVAGWLIFVQGILFFWLLYRVVLACLYLFFPNPSVKRFQNRFLGPLFGVAVFLIILGRVTSLEDVGETILARIFQNPITLGGFFFATVGLYFWLDGVSGLSYILHHTLPKFLRLDRGMLDATLTLSRYFLWLLGFGVAFQALGLDSTTVAAITGGLSVGIGFGLREILANFISGIILIFEQSIRPGDVIEIKSERVIVDKLGIRSTLVHTQRSLSPTREY